jgi:predicted phosphodiesterase
MALEKPGSMLYALGMVHETENIGIMADSHGNNGLLARAIGTLRSLGAGTLIHLGDMCDTLAPRLMEETFSLLREHGVGSVRGNNECQLIHDQHSSRTENRPDGQAQALERLPYVIRLGALWFTHSVPYPYPAATRRPISEYLPGLLEDPEVDFEILFRGHSHRPSILEERGGSARKMSVLPDRDIALDRDLRYIITVGAVEKSSCVLYRPGDHCVRFVTMPGT